MHTEATSLEWKISVFGLLMKNRGYIEFETLEKNGVGPI
jgi:hypothetical protein